MSERFLDGSFVPSQKGWEDVDYGWKGKGSTVHMMTEGEGLLLAFDVTGASVSEVTVGLDVVDRVRVPRARGRPKKRPNSLAADKSYDSAEFRRELRRRGDSSLGSSASLAWTQAYRPSSKGVPGQHVSLEGGAYSWLAGQLASAGGAV